MKLKLGTLLFFMLIIIAPTSIYAQSEASSIDKLDQISDEALHLAKSSRYEDARKLLEYFSEQFLAYTMNEHILTMDELRIITVAHNEAIEATKSTSMTHDERINRVTKFRLVMDAISSTHEPLWTEMKGPIMTAFGSMKEAAYNGNNEAFHSRLNSFLALYEMIYPSIKLDVATERVQKLDAQITFIDHYRPRVLTEASSQKELEVLENDLNNIFEDITEDEADPSLWWVIITTGSIIIATLSYVGWRKYRGEKEREKEKNHM